MKFKRTIAFIIIFLLNVSVFSINTQAKEINVDARCAIAMDSDSKIVMYEKNSREVVPIASTTKIMTILVAIKYSQLDKQVEISAKAANIRGSTVGFKKGEKVTMQELLYGLMLRSGNDAAIAIAEGVSGSVEEFVKLMNEYSTEIGIINTHFESPHGLDSENHYSTAYDLALATSVAKENQLFNTIVSSKDVDGKQLGFTRSYHNINKILWQLPDANGVKTGSTGKAGKCLVTSVKVSGKDVVIVVLNCTGRWKETEKIYQHISQQYKYKKFFDKDQKLGEVNITRGTVDLKCKKEIWIPIKGDDEYSIKIIKPEKISKKINKGDGIGTISIYAKDKKIYTEKLVADKASNNLKESIIQRLFN